MSASFQVIWLDYYGDDLKGHAHWKKAATPTFTIRFPAPVPAAAAALLNIAEMHCVDVCRV